MATAVNIWSNVLGADRGCRTRARPDASSSGGLRRRNYASLLPSQPFLPAGSRLRRLNIRAPLVLGQREIVGTARGIEGARLLERLFARARPSVDRERRRSQRRVGAAPVVDRNR